MGVIARGAAVKQEIEVTIGPDGRVTLRPRGARGAACLDLTRDLEAVLGEVERRELTPEYYDQGLEADVRVRGRQGGD